MGTCGVCGNETKKNPNAKGNETLQNQIKKQVVKGFFQEVIGSIYDKFVKDKLPEAIQKGVEVAKDVNEVYDTAQNIKHLVQNLDTKAPVDIKPPIDQNISQIPRLALPKEEMKKNEINVQMPAGGNVPNLQSKLQNLPINRDIQPQSKNKNQNDAVSQLQGGLSQTPQIALKKPQKGVIQSNLSDLQKKLQKQPSPLIPSFVSLREVDNLNIISENSKEESKLYRSFLPQQINPEISNNVPKSKTLSFIDNEEMIRDQGNGPIKGMGIQVRMSTIKLF